jgi:hypothetical protein
MQASNFYDSRLSWFRAVFGIDEPSYDECQRMFAMDGDELVLTSSGDGSAEVRWHVGAFTTPSLAELRAHLTTSAAAAAAAAASPSPAGSLTFCHLASADGVDSLIKDAANAGAIFLAASQFNCLEMTGPRVTPRHGISGYVNDPTQGPACALACPAGTIFRNYLVPTSATTLGQGDIQIDCLSDVGVLLGNDSDGVVWEMSNGYAMPTDDSLSTFRELGARLEANPALATAAEDALRIGIHWDTEVNAPTRHRCVQIYASACPVSYSYGTSSADWAPLARLVLRAAYDATLTAACCLAAERGERVKVFLTGLGGGAFGNDTAWIGEAITSALVKHRDAPLDVILVHYRSISREAWHPFVSSNFPDPSAAAAATAEAEMSMCAV